MQKVVKLNRRNRVDTFRQQKGRRFCTKIKQIEYMHFVADAGPQSKMNNENTLV